MMRIASLYIDDSTGKGKGVFSNGNIPAGTLIETAPVIVMSKEERVHLDKTRLHDYIFEWGEDKKQCCMALGYVPVYNHNYTSNCEYVMDFEKEIISVHTVREIVKGDELTINYNGDWDDATAVWFETV